VPDDNDVIINYNYVKTVIDAITVTDSTKVALTHSVSDSITVTDSTKVALTHSVADSVTVTDSVSGVSSAVGQNEVSPYPPKLLTVTAFKPKLNSLMVLRPKIVFR